MPATVWLAAVVVVGLGIYRLTRRPAPTPPPPLSPRFNAASSARPEAPLTAEQLALHAACSTGDVDKVRALLKGGVGHAFRSGEVSPLAVAIANGHTAVVRALLEAGADPNAAAVNDQPALSVALGHSRTTLVADLVRAGGAVDYADPESGGLLAAAIARRDRDMIDALLLAGAPIEQRNAGGARAIHLAALVGDLEITRLLVEKGADLHCPNFQGGTPLRSAAAGGHTKVVQLLLDAGADPSPVDVHSKRPIDYAREGGHAEVVQLLEKAKARPSERPCATAAALSWTLPPRSDATLSSLREAKRRGLTPTNSFATALEAPSMLAAVRASAGPSFQPEFELGGGPDPRLPIRPVDLVLWSYERSGQLGKTAEPALAPPPPEVARQVAGVAEHPYLLRHWSNVAAAAAGRLRPEDLRAVLSVMVHPPPGPTYLEPWDWFFRVQVAAALVASHLGSEPWAESPRRVALEAVLDGPADWSNTAAVVALLDVARRDAVARPQVVATLLRTARRTTSPPGYQHAIRPAAIALLELPAPSPEVTEELRRLLPTRVE